MDDQKLQSKIQRQREIQALISDLRKAKWHRTEPNRIDRRSWLGSYSLIEQMARDPFPGKEWREAAAEGFEHELVDEYLEALAQVVMDTMGKELRREHVYATSEDGDAWLGQYEDMSADELLAMGVEVEV